MDFKEWRHSQTTQPMEGLNVGLKQDARVLTIGEVKKNFQIFGQDSFSLAVRLYSGSPCMDVSEIECVP